MNKKHKIIQLNGPVGLLLALVVVLTVVGSIVFVPIYGVKFFWNSFISDMFSISTIKLSQAALLWFAVVAASIGYLKSKICFKFVNTADFPDHAMSKVDYEKFMEEIKKEEENEKTHH